MTSVSTITNNEAFKGVPKLNLKPLQPEKLAASLEQVVTQTTLVEKDTSNLSRSTNVAAATYGPRKLNGKTSTTATEDTKEESETKETDSSVFSQGPNKPQSVAAETLNAKSFTSIKTPEPRPTKQMVAAEDLNAKSFTSIKTPEPRPTKQMIA